MKALTLKQPWAWAVAHVGKDVENRTWKPPTSVIGQRIAIHAGKVFDRKEIRVVDEYLPDPKAHRRGCIVAVATVAGWVKSEIDWKVIWPVSSDHSVFVRRVHKYLYSDWFRGPYGWILTDIVALPEPIPCKGAQGLWNVPPEIEAEINRQIRDLDILNSVDAGKKAREVQP